jgi:hypothetical protein
MDWIKLIADKPDSFLILLAAVLTFVKPKRITLRGNLEKGLCRKQE